MHFGEIILHSKASDCDISERFEDCYIIVMVQNVGNYGHIYLAFFR
jgi:hypothetical protein